MDDRTERLDQRTEETDESTGRDEPTERLEERTGPDGEPLFVDRTEAERGIDGPFYVVYRDAGGTRRWGFVCGHCGSFQTAMDSMGRIECTACGNLKKPDEWDAAHE